MITPLQVLNLEMYRDRCYIMGILCQESSSFYSMLKTILNLPIILTSSFMGIFNSGLFEPDQMRVPNIVLNTATALILSLVSNFKLPERQSNFKTQELKFTKLLHRIEDSIVNDREGLTTDILRNFISEYDNINENLDFDIPIHIKNKIKTRYYQKRTLPNILNCELSFAKNDNRRPSLAENDILHITRSRSNSREMSDLVSITTIPE